MLDNWVPGARDYLVSWVPPGWRMLALDENTAAVGDGSHWSVLGSGSAHTLVDGSWQDHPAGSSFALPLPRAAERA